MGIFMLVFAQNNSKTFFLGQEFGGGERGMEKLKTQVALAIYTIGWGRTLFTG